MNIRSARGFPTPKTICVELTAHAVADVLANLAEDFFRGAGDPNGIGFSRFLLERTGEGIGLWPLRPRGVAADPVHTELPEEFEVISELI
jgi:hypothetical protein